MSKYIDAKWHYPKMDCINCPRKTTGGSFSTSSASGTSTLKEEGTNE